MTQFHYFQLDLEWHHTKNYQQDIKFAEKHKACRRNPKEREREREWELSERGDQVTERDRERGYPYTCISK